MRRKRHVSGKGNDKWVVREDWMRRKWGRGRDCPAGKL